MNYIYFDRITVENLKQIMDDDFVNLYRIYARDCQSRIDKLEELFNNTPMDYERVRLLAHSIKGSSSNVGALTMATLSYQLEQESQSHQVKGESLQLLKSHFSELQSELNTLVGAIS